MRVSLLKVTIWRKTQIMGDRGCLLDRRPIFDQCKGPMAIPFGRKLLSRECMSAFSCHNILANPNLRYYASLYLHSRR